MTEQTATVSAEADSGAEAAENKSDDLDAQLEAMRLAEEQAPEPEPKAEAEPKAEKKEEKKAEAEPEKAEADAKKEEKKEPLPVEEIEKRWRDQQAATKAERSKRQERDAEIAELRAQVQQLTGQQPQQEQNPYDIPDFDENPEAAVRAAIAFAKQNAQAQQQEQQMSVEEQAFNQKLNTFRTAETEYAQAVPDYMDAVKHSHQARINELTTVWGLPEQEAIETYKEELKQVIEYAVDSGNHPAHMIYQLAKTRGYQGPQPKEPETPSPEDLAAKAKADIDQRNKAQVMAKTMSGSGGSSVRGGPTVEQLNSTSSGDDFDKMFEEMARQERGY